MFHAQTAGFQRFHGLLVRRRGFEQLPRRFKVLLTDENLPPAQEASTLLGGEVGSALAAIDPVGAQERADHVGLSLASNDRQAHDAGHGASFANEVF